MTNFAGKYDELYKSDPELAEALEVIRQVRSIYTDLKEVRGLTVQYQEPIVKNSVEVPILFQSNSSGEQFM